MTSFARRERAALADLAARLGPDAPTLCGGWAVRDLLAHLVVRESSPLGAPGIVVPALAGLTERAMRRTADRDFDALVGRVRRPALLSFSSLPPLDAIVNSVEFFVHHEDLRRAGPEWSPRTLARGDQDLLWRTRRFLAPTVRGAGVPVLLRRVDVGEEHRLGSGDAAQAVTVSGEPAEIVLFCYGREQSVVELTGPAEAVARLRGAERSI